MGGTVTDLSRRSHSTGKRLTTETRVHDCSNTHTRALVRRHAEKLWCVWARGYPRRTRDVGVTAHSGGGVWQHADRSRCVRQGHDRRVDAGRRVRAAARKTVRVGAGEAIYTEQAAGAGQGEGSRAGIHGCVSM